MSDAQLAFSTIDELGALLRARKISSVELTTLYLHRLETLGRKLNAVVTITHERALREAKLADRELKAGNYADKPLLGIPYGAKDLLASAGAPTTWGAAPYREQIFHYDATVIKRLHSAGAVLAAKLAMIELAGGMGYNQSNASFTGPCNNPWNLKYWTGGSSSGPGAAVSAGLVPFAIGSETDGSIMNPSAFSGCTGLRPTYGRVSRHGAMALSWTMDKLGPMCRTAADTRTVLAAIAGADDNDPTSSTASVDLQRVVRKRWRLAVIKNAVDKAQPQVKKNFAASLALLSEFADVREVALPKFPNDAMVGAIIAAEGAAAFRRIIEDGRVLTLSDPDGRRGGYSSLVAYAVDYVDAMRQRRLMRAAYDAMFDKVDAVVTPTENTVAYPHGVPFDKAYPKTGFNPITTPANLTGIPALALPNGFGPHGLPTSISFTARSFHENYLITLGELLQARSTWHHNHPRIATA